MSRSERNVPRPLLRVDDVAVLLGYHPQTVYKKARSGDIPSVKIGGHLRFRPEAIEALIEAGTQERPSEDAEELAGD